MANNVTESTMKFKVDISDLKANMQAANKEIRLANAEFKAATASMDDWSTSADGLTAKIDQQQKTLKAQKTVLNSLEKQYEMVAEEQGENSKAATDLKIKILNQQAAVAKTEKSIDDYTKALDDVGKESKDASKSVDELTKEVEEASEGFSVMKGAMASLIADGIRGLISGIGNAVTETREFRKEMSLLKEVADENGVAFEKTQEAYQKLLATRGDEGAVTETLNNLLTAGFDESNLDAITSGVEGLAIRFKDTLSQEGIADSIQEWIGSAGESLSGNFAEALERMGYNLEDVKEKTKGMTDAQRQNWVISTLNKEGLTALSDEYRKNNADAIALSDTQFRLTTAMAEVGAKVEPVLTTIKTGFADILEEVVKFVETIDTEALSENITAGFKWIKENGSLVVSTLSAIVGGFVAFKAATAISSVITMFQTFFSVLQAGQGIQAALNAIVAVNPYVLIATAVAALVVGLITLWNTNEDFRNAVIKIWENIKEALGVAIDAIVKFFTVTVPDGIDKMLEWFKKLPSEISKFFTDAYNKVVAWANNMRNKAIETGTNFLNSIVKFFNELPYKIGYAAGQALAKVIEWGKSLYKFATEDIPKFIDTMIKWFSELPGKIATWLTNTYNKVVQWGTNMVTKAKEVGSNAVNSVITFFSQLPGKIATWLTNTINKVVSFGTELANKGAAAGKKLLDSVVNGITSLPGKIYEIGTNVVSGLWNGISSGIGWLGKKVSGFVDGVIKGFKDGFDTHSPSRETAWIGEMVVEGLGNSIANGTKDVVKKARAMATEVLGAINDPLSGASLNAKVSGNLNAVRRSGTFGAAGIAAGGQIVTFNQTINSPKALDRLSIYRQTNTMLFSAKGRLRNA